MNLTEMTAALRCDLHDEDDSNYRWTDAELEHHLLHAVNEFSEALPLEQTVTIATTDGSREVDISSLEGLVNIAAVEYPTENFPRQFQRFSFWAETLLLLGVTVPDGADCCIYYGKLHSLGESTSTVPVRYDDLILCGGAAYALLEWAAYAVNRVNLGGNAAVGQFLTLGKEKLSLFRYELKQHGRRNQVRSHQLYCPPQGSGLMTTDFGP